MGANADLVRGFITTPLERVIASADGIDYVESSSAQALSTIIVHLKLNYDTNAALTQIQAKVAQVRNDLPPEAQAPVIELETADNQFAAMYLGFSSDRPGPEPDHRLPDPRRPTEALGHQRRAARRHPGRPHLRHAHLAQARQDGRPRASPPPRCGTPWRDNNYLSALGKTKGSMVSVNLVANTDLRTPEEFRQLVVKEDKGVVVRLGEIADVVLGADNYDQDVRFNGQTATFMGIWVLPTANSLDVIRQVRAAMPEIQAQLPWA